MVASFISFIITPTACCETNIRYMMVHTCWWCYSDTPEKL